MNVKAIQDQLRWTLLAEGIARDTVQKSVVDGSDLIVVSKSRTAGTPVNGSEKELSIRFADTASAQMAADILRIGIADMGSDAPAGTSDRPVRWEKKFDVA